MNDTPLTIAAFHGHEPIVNLLLTYGANIMGQGYLGKTAIERAVDGAHFEMADRLKKLAELKNYTLANPPSPADEDLCSAIDACNMDGVIAALNKNANVHTRNGYPLAIAVSLRKPDIVEYLAAHGASPARAAAFFAPDSQSKLGNFLDKVPDVKDALEKGMATYAQKNARACPT